MRDRFLAHEFYDEFYGHLMSRTEWNRLMMNSDFMAFFRRTMFRRVIPNLNRINLLSDRIRRHYDAMGLLGYENEKAAPELTLSELMDTERPKRKIGKKKTRKKSRRRTGKK